VYPGRHNSWYGNDVQRLRLKAVLNVVLGADSRVVNDIRPPRVPETDRLYSTIINRLQQGKIGCLGIWGQNPLQAHTNTYRTINALRKTDFIFCCDIYPGEAALYADIILPEASFLERSEVVVSPGRRRAALRQAVLQPRFETREPYWIVKQMSSRLGRGRRFGFDSVRERLTDDLRQMGLSWDKLRERGFAAPLIAAAPAPASAASAVKIRLKNELPHGAIEQLLEFTAVSPPPKGFARLLSGRSPVDSRGLVNNRWLRHELEENELWLNDRLARQLGIVQGQGLFLENQDGLRSMRPVRIKVTPGIRADCLYMAHGFGCWSPFLTAAYGHGVADSPLMTRSISDPLSGVRGGRVNFVRFIKNGIPLSIPSLVQPRTAYGANTARDEENA
ncbi:Anaerobic dehydrogenases, typically selenocysteine-containing, partial [hydrothermal vent metagenome]